MVLRNNLFSLKLTHFLCTFGYHLINIENIAYGMCPRNHTFLNLFVPKYDAFT